MKQIARFILILLFCIIHNLDVNGQPDSLYSKLKQTSGNQKKIKLLSIAIQKSNNNSENDHFILLFDSLQKSFTSASDIAFSNLELSKIYRKRSDVQKALEYTFKALNQYESIKKDSGIMESHHEVALSFKESKNYKGAITHLYNSLILAVADSRKELVGNNHSLLGAIFKDLGQTDSSLYHHRIALKHRLEIGNKKNIAASYNDIGLAYKRKGDLETSLEYLKKALEIREEVKDYRGISGACINIGNTLKRLKKHKDAYEYFNRGLQIAQEKNFYDFYLNGIAGRAENALMMKDYENAAKDFQYYVDKKDSMYQINLNSQISEMEVKYKSEKKDAELKLQEEQLIHQAEQNNKQKLVIIASVSALIMALLAIIFIYRSYLQNKRNTAVLSLKNKVIEEKNREITDSINYAKLIQQSLLASKEVLDRNLESYFILYKPKDIVSGDFYWAHESNDGFIIAGVDCTGHGVPGAFMSLIGKENLDKAVSRFSSPGKILGELNKNVKRSLNQNNSGASKDGMDAAILRIRKNNGTAPEVLFAGANRPLYILRRNSLSLEEIKPTKQAIGGLTSADQVYDEHFVSVERGDTLVIGTDGYADQFGSASNKKLTTKRFKQLLQSIANESPQQQKEKLDSFFKTWKGNQDQLDDLLVIGITV